MSFNFEVLSYKSVVVVLENFSCPKVLSSLDIKLRCIEGLDIMTYDLADFFGDACEHVVHQIIRYAAKYEKIIMENLLSFA